MGICLRLWVAETQCRAGLKNAWRTRLYPFIPTGAEKIAKLYEALINDYKLKQMEELRNKPVAKSEKIKLHTFLSYSYFINGRCASGQPDPDTVSWYLAV